MLSFGTIITQRIVAYTLQFGAVIQRENSLIETLFKRATFLTASGNGRVLFSNNSVLAKPSLIIKFTAGRNSIFCRGLGGAFSHLSPGSQVIANLPVGTTVSSI